MKKLLLLTVAITSVMTHAMDPVDASGSFGQENQQAAAMVFIEIPVKITAQTPLGAISRMQPEFGISEYEREGITVGFNRREQSFYGVRHAIDSQNCQPIENQAEVETLFNQYKAAFDATPRENRTAECTIQ
jgi:hypothetical protein